MSGVLARLRHALNDELLARRQPRRHDPHPAWPSRWSSRCARSSSRCIAPSSSTCRSIRRRRGAIFTIAASDYAVTVLLTDALRRVSRDAPGVTVVIIPLRERTPGVRGSRARSRSSCRRRTRLRRCRTRCCSKTRSPPSCGAGIRVWVTRFTPDQYRRLPHAVVSFSDDTRINYDERLAERAGFGLHAQVVSAELSRPASADRQHSGSRRCKCGWPRSWQRPTRSAPFRCRRRCRCWRRP